MAAAMAMRVFALLMAGGLTGCATFDWAVPRRGTLEARRATSATGETFDWFEYTTDATRAHDAIIVFFPGSGCAGVGPWMERLFWPLDGRFLVVARDKRGVDPTERDPRACSEAFYRENTLRQIVEDQVAFVRFVWRRHPARQRILFGVSEGGFTVPEIASRAGGTTHAVLLSSTLASGEALLRVDLAGRVGAAGVEQALEVIRTDAAPEGQSDAHGHSNRFKAELLAYRPADFVESMALPVLMANGGRDRRIPAVLRRETCAVARAARGRFSWFFVPEAGHDMKIDGGESQARPFFRAFAAWLDGTPDAPPRVCPEE